MSERMAAAGGPQLDGYLADDADAAKPCDHLSRGGVLDELVMLIRAKQSYRAGKPSDYASAPTTGR